MTRCLQYTSIRFDRRVHCTFFVFFPPIPILFSLHANLDQRLPEDEKAAETLEDSSCLVLQKRFRGIVGRAYAAWYKGSIVQASLLL